MTIREYFEYIASKYREERVGYPKRKERLNKKLLREFYINVETECSPTSPKRKKKCNNPSLSSFGEEDEYLEIRRHPSSGSSTDGQLKRSGANQNPPQGSRDAIYEPGDDAGRTADGKKGIHRSDLNSCIPFLPMRSRDVSNPSASASGAPFLNNRDPIFGLGNPFNLSGSDVPPSRSAAPQISIGGIPLPSILFSSKQSQEASRPRLAKIKISLNSKQQGRKIETSNFFHLSDNPLGNHVLGSQGTGDNIAVTEQKTQLPEKPNSPKVLSENPPFSVGKEETSLEGFDDIVPTQLPHGMIQVSNE